MAEEEEEQQQKQPLTSKSSTGASRPTISLPPRPFGEMFFTGGVGFIGFSPGPMTLVSNMFSDPDEFKSFSQLLAGAIASPAAAVAAAAVVASAYQTSVSSVGGSGADVDQRFKQNRPTGLMITQPPAMFTVPSGLSPATLLDSPSFFGLFSPIQSSDVVASKRQAHIFSCKLLCYLPKQARREQLCSTYTSRWWSQPDYTTSKP